MIDPALEARGWRRTDVHVEEISAAIDIVNHQLRRRPKGRSDHVIRRPLKSGEEPIPLAIIEAKHEGLPPQHGLQQGKSYRIGELHRVPFVFFTNDHQFVEYDEETGVTSDPNPIAEFPTPDELVARYLGTRKLSLATPEMKFLACFLLSVPVFLNDASRWEW